MILQPDLFLECSPVLNLTAVTFKVGLDCNTFSLGLLQIRFNHVLFRIMNGNTEKEMG